MARSTFEVKLYVEMMKSARRCGTKRMSKSKPAKHTRVGALLEVDMFKKCTPIWGEGHFEVKSVKINWEPGTLFEVQMSEKRTLWWCEARFEVKMAKVPHVRTTFGS